MGSFKVENLGTKRVIAIVLIISSVAFLFRLYEPYYKKPLLFFWTVALSFKVLGFNEFAARLPLFPFRNPKLHPLLL